MSDSTLALVAFLFLTYGTLSGALLTWRLMRRVYRQECQISDLERRIARLERISHLEDQLHKLNATTNG
jgi:hypothetical protein